jgi:hypothetical protein
MLKHRGAYANTVLKKMCHKLKVSHASYYRYKAGCIAIRHAKETACWQDPNHHRRTRVSAMGAPRIKTHLPLSESIRRSAALGT